MITSPGFSRLYGGLLTCVLAFTILCLPLQAGAQDRRWEVTKPWYKGGSTYQYVSSGLLPQEFAQVDFRYTTALSVEADSALKLNDPATYERLVRSLKDAVGPDSFEFARCKTWRTDSDLGRCVARVIREFDTLDLSFALTLDHPASGVHPVLFNSVSEFLALAKPETDGKLVPIFPDWIRLSEHCWFSKDGITPRKLYSNAAEAKIVTTGSKRCALGEYRSAYFVVSLTRSRLRALQGDSIRFKYPSFGLRYKRTDGKDFTIWIPFLTLENAM
ncbi:MAG: hypothetical protein AAF393_01495 [Pseudomonadota bacterium]